MKIYLTSFMLFFAFARLAVAEPQLVTDVRELLDDRNFAQLESRLTEAHEAGNLADIQTVYGTLFVTAHRERLAASYEWLEAYPKSYYAAAAIGQAHKYRAFLSRGQNVLAYTSNEARMQFSEELAAAAAALKYVNGAESDFLPLLELAISLEMTHLRTGDLLTYVDRTLDVAPERWVLLKALSSLHLNWGGSPSKTIELCARYAGRIANYSRELCFIDAAFHIGVEGVLRKRALAALDDRDEDFLNYAREDAYLNEWSNRPGAKEFVVNRHRDSLGPLDNFASFSRRALEIEETFHIEGYFNDARQKLREVAFERLEDNPDSPNLRRYILPYYFIGERLVKGETRAHWEVLLTHQEFLSDTWSSGYLLTANETGEGDLESLMPYLNNLIYYSNHRVQKLHLALSFLTGMTKPDTESSSPKGVAPQNVDCQAVRVIRLINAICQQNQGNDTCGYDTAPIWFANEAVKRTARTGRCSKERNADVRELLFSPIPAEAFLSQTSKP